MTRPRSPTSGSHGRTNLPTPSLTRQTPPTLRCVTKRFYTSAGFGPPAIPIPGRPRKRRMTLIRRLLAVALSAGLIGATVPSPVRANDELPVSQIKHVLLISVDGLHAL